MELRTVNGKKQYGYLKKPLKDMLDFIVDELEKMPEVATYYSIWNDLRDTLESYYKSRSGQAQSAFAAERISRNQERHYSRSGAFALSARRFFAGENTLSAASHQVRLPSEYLLSSSVKLFHQMRQVFHDTAAPPSNPMGICVDSKRRKNLMQKRVAIGHKQDAHGQSQSSFG